MGCGLSKKKKERLLREAPERELKQFLDSGKHLDDEELDRLQDIFRAECEPGRDLVSPSNILKLLRLEGLSETAMSKNIYARFDKNQDGQVSEDDFLSVMGLLLHGAVKSKQYFLFSLWDLDKDGVWRPQEARNFVRDLLRIAANPSAEDPDTLTQKLRKNKEYRCAVADVLANISQSVRPENMKLREFRTQCLRTTITFDQFSEWLSRLAGSKKSEDGSSVLVDRLPEWAQLLLVEENENEPRGQGGNQATHGVDGNQQEEVSNAGTPSQLNASENNSNPPVQRVEQSSYDVEYQ